jgi:hypothetical protein
LAPTGKKYTGQRSFPEPKAAPQKEPVKII